MLNGRSALFCLFFVFTIETCAGSSDYQPFNLNTAPSVKVIPDTDGNFIHLKQLDQLSLQAYIDSMNRFLEPYIKPTEVAKENLYICDFNSPPYEHKVCAFDVQNLFHCSPENDFGFRKNSPCLLFTLSQVSNWTPIVLSGSDIQNNTNSFSTIPASVNASISRAARENPPQKYIWFTCEGETAADKEALGPVTYYPRNGFSTYYFAFNNVEGYQSPIVGAHFERPRSGVNITIICKAWANNIPLDEENGSGYKKIHLLID